MKKLMLTAALSVAATLSFTAHAQEAQSMDQLLQTVNQSRNMDRQEDKAREAQFLRQKNEQTRLLNEAKAELRRQEQIAARLEKTFDDNKKVIAAKKKELTEAKGTLNELFGHLTSFAGDLREIFATSITSAQFADRDAPLDVMIEKLNSDDKLPSMAEIESLWFEMQREMIATGQVVKFNATISHPDGSTSEEEVVRIGAYNLVAGDEYLSFANGSVEVLPRQPAGKFRSGAEELGSATSGFTAVGLDPTGPFGGTLLSALVGTPSVEERWHQGGMVGYVITALGVLAVLLAVWRMLVLIAVSGKVSSQLKATEARPNNPLGRILMVAESNKSADTETLELKLSEQILKERPPIEFGINLLKVISMVAPLLGLLGTVTGMILTFQAITIFGAGDPKAMAGGISSALMTTVLGLVVAIPTVLLHTIVNGRAKRVIAVLEEQATGIVAMRAEERN